TGFRSCRSPLAHQMRLILHTGAYWLLLDLRTAIPELESAAAYRVRHHPSAAVENRRPHHPDYEPHSHPARRMLSGGRDIQPDRLSAATVGTVTQRGDDARCPASPIHSPQRVDSVPNPISCQLRRISQRVWPKITSDRNARLHKNG